MKSSLQVGRILGIPLQFHWSFVLVGIWLLYDSWQPGEGIIWANLGWLLLWVCLIFFTVLLHEIGHAIMARWLGIGTEKIVLYPIGGGAFLEQIPEDPGKEIKIAIAGPVVNLLLVGLAALVFFLSSDNNLSLLLQFFLQPNSNIVVFDVSLFEQLTVVFLVLNLLLGVFNLLPAFPLDGGRVLRAVLSYRWSRERATIIAARLGMLGGLLLLALAVYLGDAFFGIGALLIFALAALEHNVQGRRQKLRQALIKDYLEPNFQRLYLSPSTSLAEARQMIINWEDTPIVLLDQWQQPHGITNKLALQATELDGLLDRPLAQVVGAPQWVGLHPEENLLTAAEQLEEHQVFAFPVMDHYGKVLGLLNRQIIQEVLDKK